MRTCPAPWGMTAQEHTFTFCQIFFISGGNYTLITCIQYTTMVAHSECEISQSWRTQFSSHDALNLNRAVMPPLPLLHFCSPPFQHKFDLHLYVLYCYMQIVLYCIVFYNNVFRFMLLLEINFILSYLISLCSPTLNVNVHTIWVKVQLVDLSLVSLRLITDLITMSAR